MSNVEHDNDAGLADFMAGWGWIIVTYAVIGLTNFGQRPVQSTRLAEVLGQSVTEAEALARQWGWPGTRVDDGLISVDPERAKSATRRRVWVANRQFGVTGCAGDIFFYAPLVRPSIQVEETCPATGTAIHLAFTPSRVESVDPGSAVVPMSPEQCDAAGVNAARDITVARDVEEVDANV